MKLVKSLNGKDIVLTNNFYPGCEIFTGMKVGGVDEDNDTGDVSTFWKEDQFEVLVVDYKIDYNQVNSVENQIKNSKQLAKYAVNKIEQAIDQCEEYIASYLEKEVKLELSTLDQLLANTHLSLDDIATLICNLEDHDTMQELVNGNTESFDPWDESQFNDSYWDMSEDLNLHGE